MHEIVVPDTLFDWRETVAQAKAFSMHTQKYRYMAVAQGTTLEEALRCIDAFMSMGYITSIGIPRLLNREYQTTRVQVMRHVEKEGWGQAVEFHALGYSEWMEEVMILSQFESVRGIDTSMPIYMGQMGKALTSHWSPRPQDYFQKATVNPQIEENIDQFLKWAKYDIDAPLPDKPEIPF